jgi:hypothetical protein
MPTAFAPTSTSIHNTYTDGFTQRTYIILLDAFPSCSLALPFFLRCDDLCLLGDELLLAYDGGALLLPHHKQAISTVGYGSRQWL